MNAEINNTAILFNRYLWLMDVILNSEGGVTLEEIKERWLRSDMSSGEALPRKTFDNHRKAIQDLFDVTISCDRRTNRYYVENRDDIKSDKLRLWLLETFALNNFLAESKGIRQRIALEPIPSGRKHLMTVLQAIKKNRCLKIVYQHNYDSQRENTYEIEPYGLKVFHQRWYVIAKSVEMGGIYTFSLDRVQSMVVTEKEAVITPGFDCEDYFADVFGIIHEPQRKAERVIIRVYGEQANYIRELPLHPTQKETGKTEEYTEFEYWLAPAYDFRMELLSNGADVEVIRPVWFRNEVKNIVTKMTMRYE